MGTFERRRASMYGGGTLADASPSKAPNGTLTFSGYVVKWDAISEDLGGFVETIRKGAFTNVLTSGKRVTAVLDHEKKVCNLLGDTANRTLILSEDATGLAFVITAPDTSVARDAAKVARRGGLGMSFTFICGVDKRTTTADGTRLREILEIALLDEISLVVDPAYRSSAVTVVETGGAASDKPAGQRKAPSVDYLRRKLQLDEAEAMIRLGRARL